VVRVASVHSFRGGTGKSNLTANVAVLLARRGARVGVVDTDVQSPGIHVLFGLRGADVATALNDFLFQGVPITEVAHDVTPEGSSGAIHLIPSSVQPGQITRVLRDGYDARHLVDGLRALVDRLRLDVLLIDTHPGLGEETLLSLTLSDTVLLVLRPDQQDYEGTGVLVEVAAGLRVPRTALVLNKVPATLDAAPTARPGRGRVRLRGGGRAPARRRPHDAGIGRRVRAAPPGPPVDGELRSDRRRAHHGRSRDGTGPPRRPARSAR
jgi:septum site-determining protein MinD